MLTLILSALLFAFTFVFLVLDTKDYIQLPNKVASIFSWGLCIGLLIFCITLGGHIIGYINKENRIREDQYRRNSCIYELSAAKSVEEKEKAINDIFEWNSHVERMKKISNNPYLNYMVNLDYVDSLEYIETDVLYMEVKDE